MLANCKVSPFLDGMTISDLNKECGLWPMCCIPGEVAVETKNSTFTGWTLNIILHQLASCVLCTTPAWALNTFHGFNMFHTLNRLGPEPGLEAATPSLFGMMTYWRNMWPPANGLIGGWLTALVSLCNGTSGKSDVLRWTWVSQICLEVWAKSNDHVTTNIHETCLCSILLGNFKKNQLHHPAFFTDSCVGFGSCGFGLAQGT